MKGKLSRDVYTDVKRLAVEKANTLTAEDIFTDYEFARYIQNLVASMTGRYTNRIRLQLCTSGPTAWTDGDMISLNIANPIANSYETLLDKFLAQMGIIFHETGHILFLDFNAENKATERILAGVFYGDDPVAATEEEEEDLDELMMALDNPRYAKVFAKLYQSLSNVIADPHDEDKMMQTFGNYIRQGIMKSREALKTRCTPLEDMNHDSPLAVMHNIILQLARFGRVNVKDPKSAEASVYLSEADRMKDLLEEAKATDDPSVKFTKINQIILILWPYIRFELVRAELTEDLIKSVVNELSGENAGEGDGGQEQSKNGSGSNTNPSQPSDGQDQSQDSSDQGTNSGQSTQANGQQSNSQSTAGSTEQSASSGAPSQGMSQGAAGSSMQSSSPDGCGNTSSTQLSIRNVGREQLANTPTPSSEQIKAVMDALAEAVRGMGPAAPVPEHRKSAAPAIVATQEAKSGEKHKDVLEEQKASAQQNESLEQILASVVARIAQEQAMNEVEKELKEDLLEKVNCMDMRTSHEGVPLKVSRVLEVTPSDIALYEEEMKVLKPYSRRIQKKILDVLRDLRAGTVQHRKLFGSRLEANHVYRPDQRFYSSKKLPQDVPDMAITILVDGSGSMSGPRNELSRRAAFLLHDFCRSLNIPVHVANHNAIGDMVHYNIYTDFDSIGSRDAYRISKMTTSGCNRDGMALDIAGNLLANRPEDVKLLIIISDGRPNHPSRGKEYGGPSAEEDIYEIVRALKKKGVETIAAAIGSDRDVLLRIYREGYLDIVDLDNLPMTLANIVRKRILP